MSLPTWVCLFRNGGCVVKDLLDSKHMLMQPVLGEMSMIECFIAPLQAGGAYFAFCAAIPVLVGAASAWFKAVAPPSETDWLAALALAGSSSKAGTAGFAELDVKATFAASRTGFWIAVCKFTIGCAFTALCLDSCHLGSGVVVQWSVVGLELALLYILSVVAAGAVKQRTLAADMVRLSRALKAGEVPLDSPASLRLALGAAHNVTGKLQPLPPSAPWTGACVELSDPLGVLATKAHLQEVDNLHGALQKEAKAHRLAIADELAVLASTGRNGALLDAICFVLNATAFCGYAVFPVTFFAPSEAALKAWMPFWPGNSSARWTGNLTGDLAWTIEPFLLLVCPYLIARAERRLKAKLKKD